MCRAQTILVLPEQVAKMRAECPRPEALRGQESEAGREPLLAAVARAAESPTLEALHELEAAPEPLLAAAARAAESPTLEALHELEAAPEPLLAAAARAAESPTLEALHELEAAPEPAVAMLAERGECPMRVVTSTLLVELAAHRMPRTPPPAKPETMIFFTVPSAASSIPARRLARAIQVTTPRSAPAPWSTGVRSIYRAPQEIRPQSFVEPRTSNKTAGPAGAS